MHELLMTMLMVDHNNMHMATVWDKNVKDVISKTLAKRLRSSTRITLCLKFLSSISGLKICHDTLHGCVGQFQAVLVSYVSEDNYNISRF